MTQHHFSAQLCHTHTHTHIHTLIRLDQTKTASDTFMSALYICTLASSMTCMADEADWPCGLKPPRTLMDWGSSPTCPITAMPDSTTARADAARIGPPPAHHRMEQYERMNIVTNVISRGVLSLQTTKETVNVYEVSKPLTLTFEGDCHMACDTSAVHCLHPGL